MKKWSKLLCLCLSAALLFSACSDDDDEDGINDDKINKPASEQKIQ